MKRERQGVTVRKTKKNQKKEPEGKDMKQDLAAVNLF